LNEPVIKEVSKGSVDDDNYDFDDDDDSDGSQSVVEIEDIVVHDEGKYVVPEEAYMPTCQKKCLMPQQMKRFQLTQ